MAAGTAYCTLILRVAPKNVEAPILIMRLRPLSKRNSELKMRMKPRMEWVAALKMRVQFGMGAGTAYCTLILRMAFKERFGSHSHFETQTPPRKGL